ncbi:hypothetical protein ES705_43804 [subsurface metagenome]
MPKHKCKECGEVFYGWGEQAKSRMSFLIFQIKGDGARGIM